MKIIFKNHIKNWQALLGIIILIFIFAFIRFDLVISEKRYFQVVDEKEIPIAHCEVYQIWTQYALSYEEMESSSCGENGFVYLPKRTVRTSWSELIAGAYEKFKKYGLHASYMSDDIVAISAPGFETEVIFPDDLKSNKVILKKKQPR